MQQFRPLPRFDEIKVAEPAEAQPTTSNAFSRPAQPVTPRAFSRLTLPATSTGELTRRDQFTPTTDELKRLAQPTPTTGELHRSGKPAVTTGALPTPTRPTTSRVPVVLLSGPQRTRSEERRGG